MKSVVHLREKFLDSPTYSVAMGGPGGALVAAGSAWHSVVCLGTYVLSRPLLTSPGEGSDLRHALPVRGLQVVLSLRRPVTFFHLPQLKPLSRCPLPYPSSSPVTMLIRNFIGGAQAARRVNDLPTTIRIFEGLKEKVRLFSFLSLSLICLFTRG